MNIMKIILPFFTETRLGCPRLDIEIGAGSQTCLDIKTGVHDLSLLARSGSVTLLVLVITLDPDRGSMTSYGS